MLDNRFVHPYYLLNASLLLSYILLRFQRLSAGALSRPDMFGVTREVQIYFSLALLLFTRALSAPTLDVYLASAFSFARVAVLLCLYYMHLRLAAIFLALWTLIYIVVPQPRYRLPSSIATLNVASFGDRITRNPHRTIYVLWCHAAWSARCSQLAPVLARLAALYDHPRLRLARLDVAKFHTVAEQLGLSVSPTSKVLPCLVCFVQGKEVARLPVTNAQGLVPREYIRGFTAVQAAEALRLDERLELAKKWEREAQARYQAQKGK